MEFKPEESRSFSIVKGVLSDEKLCIHEVSIPTEKPFKSFSTWYDAALIDKEQIQGLKQPAVSGIMSIEASGLPGKLKLWCLQFSLLPQLLWSLTVYDVPIS